MGTEFKPGFLYCPRCGHQAWSVLGQGNAFEIMMIDEEEQLELSIYGCKCDKCGAIWFGTQDLCCELITANEWVEKAWSYDDRRAALSYKQYVDEQVTKGDDSEKYKIASPVRRC